MPQDDILAQGGRQHGFQLWVNLPRRDKRMAPRYQELKAASIPKVETPDGKVKIAVIAGEALGVHSRIDTRTPIEYLDIRIAPGASFSKPLSAGDNAFVYVVDGSGRFGRDRREAKDGELVLLARDGDSVDLEAGTEELRALVIAGTPIAEPVARYGPFVMNTRAELIEAVEDFQNGRF
jgi:redox-sensitive bicupin YhaK (pirin superfamily)